MKKYLHPNKFVITLLLLIFSLFLFTGCVSESSTKTTNTSTNTSVTDQNISTDDELYLPPMDDVVAQ